MAHLTWTKDLNTDIPVIDNQHRRIVDYINNLHHAIEAGDRDEVGEVLEELVDYTMSHFAFEEDLMEKAHYPFVSAHKKVHKLFTKRVGDYVQRFEMGEDVARQLHTTLKTWLVNHIQHDDADYAEVVRGLMKKESSGGFFKRLFGH
jgi:hemerythrin